MLCPRLISRPADKSVTLVTGLVLLWSMVSPSPAAGSLPELTTPEGFGVNIHFTGERRDLTPKAASRATRALSATLAGCGIEKQLAPSNEKDIVYLLSKGNRRALALWTTDTDHERTLPFKTSEGTLVDMLGQSRPISGQADQLKPAVSGSPQYLLRTE